MTAKNILPQAGISEGKEGKESKAHNDAKVQDRARFLRRVLQGNAAFSTLCALLLLLDGRPVASFLGLTNPAAVSYLWALGVGLLCWALLALWVSTRPTLSRTGVFSVIEGDVLWVVTSVVLLIGGWLSFSTAGNWAVAIVADVVALFAILQYVGWRRLTNG